ncbi:MAG TPA: hypothetical protein DD381_09340 [Lentisphaeria bacterium]|nr:MAG: hypothetical protein A2X47_11485 [Lentisphaerae bacterium GWF2_38_69]HBM16527.1 hypothetical protein [Lentisphaeria bacterium]
MENSRLHSFITRANVANKYLLSIFIMVFIVFLITSEMMLSILKLEVKSSYQTLETYAKNETHLISFKFKEENTHSKDYLDCIFSAMAKNKPSFIFSETGDTLIAKQKNDNFQLLYSARKGDIANSVPTNLDDAFQNSFARSLLFGDTQSLIGIGLNNQIILSACVPLKINGNNLFLITSIDFNEIIKPYSNIILTTLIVEIILLTIGIIFIVMIYTKALRKEIKTAAKDLALSRKQICELKQIEKSLADIKKDMEEALDVGLFGFWLYDIPSGKSIRSLMHDHIFGYDALVEKWNFDSFINHVIEEDKEEVRKSFDEAAVSNSNIDIACRIYKRNKELRWIWVRGRKRSDGCLIGIVRDITARKKMEKELNDFKDHLEELVHKRTTELEAEKEKLQQAHSNIKSLNALLPICSGCGKIREEDGNWNNLENYIQKHTDSKFSHSLCPDCLKTHYPNIKV